MPVDGPVGKQTQTRLCCILFLIANQHILRSTVIGAYKIMAWNDMVSFNFENILLLFIYALYNGQNHFYNKAKLMVLATSSSNLADRLSIHIAKY